MDEMLNTKNSGITLIFKRNILVILIMIFTLSLSACVEPEPETEPIPEVETYTITLLGNEGTPYVRQIEVEFGEPLPSDIPAPVREGFEFLGYFSGPYMFDSLMYYTRDMISYYDWDCECDGTLYALWS